MEIHNLLAVKSRTELREWLIHNHKTEKECWVVVKRERPTDDNTFWYIVAVEEALCFGWIDSTNRALDNDHTIQRFTPRQTKSSYSQPNKERLRWLAENNLIHLVQPLLSTLETLIITQDHNTDLQRTLARVSRSLDDLQQDYQRATDTLVKQVHSLLQAESKLSSSETHLKHIIDLLPQQIYAIDNNDRMILANES